MIPTTFWNQLIPIQNKEILIAHNFFCIVEYPTSISLVDSCVNTHRE